jgi:phosphatidylserine/phosphatidylglycerophosphate/cardiolipin synthase-like enzyme
MDSSLPIIEAVTKLAAKVPGDVIERVAQILSTCEPSVAVSRIADEIPHVHHRSLCARFLGAWIASGSAHSGAEVSLALRTAAYLERVRDREQAVELVWTGPNPSDRAFRRTEQVMLQVLEAAQQRITLVSYAVYRIPHVSDALVRAARRGVRINALVETPDKLEGESEYNTIRALGAEVATCSTLYYWPKEERAKDSSGKLGILHVKCVVADGRWLFLSSANLTEYAFSINMELGALITGGRHPARVEEHFDSLIMAGSLKPVGNPSR